MENWYTEKHTPTRGLTFRIEEHLYRESSPYQTIEILKTIDFGTVMLLDGVVMVTEKDEFAYHEMLTQPTIFTHPKPERVLIIGGGDGGTLKQVLRHPEVDKATVVEIDEMVPRVAKLHFPLLAEAFKDPRAEVVFEDGIEYLKNRKDEFDVILIDSTDPVGVAEGLFHRDFYQNCHHALKADGILTIQSESPWIPHLQPVIQRTHKDLKSLFAHVMPYTAAIQTYQAGFWLFQMASKKHHPLKVKLRHRQMDFRYYTRELHQGCFALPQFVQDILI